MSNILDRDLLTFSNLTNLEWQFINLEELKGKTDNYPTITEILIPENFIRKYDDGRKEKIYPEGIDEMRKKAPVAMNYLEECDKGSKEGDFLKNWEAYD